MLLTGITHRFLYILSERRNVNGNDSFRDIENIFPPSYGCAKNLYRTRNSDKTYFINLDKINDCSAQFYDANIHAIDKLYILPVNYHVFIKQTSTKAILSTPLTYYVSTRNFKFVSRISKYIQLILWGNQEVFSLCYAELSNNKTGSHIMSSRIRPAILNFTRSYTQTQINVLFSVF